MEIINIAYAQGMATAPSLAEIFLRILNFILQIFGFIVIIGLVISGIMYFTSGGSEERARDAKRAAFYSVVGAILGLGAFLIIKQISNLLK